MNRRAMLRRSTAFALPFFLALPLALAGCDAGQPRRARAAARGRGDRRRVHAGRQGRQDRPLGDFAGKYRIVYFGYTYLPRRLPAPTSSALMQGLRSVRARTDPGAAAKVQPIFITIDPARDTPAVVGEFAAAFSPRLLGLTGTPEQVDSAAKAFRVFYQPRARSSRAAATSMDHSRIAYLMDPRGQADRDAADRPGRRRRSPRSWRNGCAEGAASGSVPLEDLDRATSGKRCATAAASAACTSWRTRTPARSLHTNVACKLLDTRHRALPRLSPPQGLRARLPAADPAAGRRKSRGCPTTCAYRLRAEASRCPMALPAQRRPRRGPRAGASVVAGRVISETDAGPARASSSVEWPTTRR